MKRSKHSLDELDHALIDAATRGDDQAIEPLLAAGADPTAKGSAALAIASRSSNPRAAQLLAPFPHQPGVALYAIGELAARDHADAVAALLKCVPTGADLQPALIAAVESGSLACVEILLPLADPRDGNPCLLRLAAHWGHRDCALALLPHCDPCTAMDAPIAQALFAACSNADRELALELSRRCDLASCAPTALMRASCSDDPVLLNLFLPACAPGAIFDAARNALRNLHGASLAILAAALPEPEFSLLWTVARQERWAKETLDPIRLAMLDRQALEQASGAPSRASPKHLGAL